VFCDELVGRAFFIKDGCFLFLSGFKEMDDIGDENIIKKPYPARYDKRGNKNKNGLSAQVH
jgi:hypothetical protein